MLKLGAMNDPSGVAEVDGGTIIKHIHCCPVEKVIAFLVLEIYKDVP